mgnify:CR=1 FL=1
MPNGRIHASTSMPAGAICALSKCSSENDLERFVESLGGTIGGYMGGILPDWIDPPLHPGHRSLAHGMAPVTACAAVWYQNLDGWQNHLRRIADRHAYCLAVSADFACTAEP